MGVIAFLFSLRRSQGVLGTPLLERGYIGKSITASLDALTVLTSIFFNIKLISRGIELELLFSGN